MIARGSIILFKNASTWYEKLICRATGGPYYHCAIALSAKEVIEAMPHGISVDPAPTNPDVFTVIDITPYTSAANIERGLAWAVAQKGKEYGTLDIVYQAIKFLAPNNPFQFCIAGHMDCSDFACRYLWEAGVTLPASYLDAYTVTPNDIGRAFNLVAPRKSVA